MDLELEAHLAVVKVKKVHAEAELKQYQFVISYATPDTEIFNTLLDRIEKLVEDICFYEEKLKQI